LTEVSFVRFVDRLGATAVMRTGRLSEPRHLIGGVDAHKAAYHASVVAITGQLLAARSFPATGRPSQWPRQRNSSA
jgi:hypothetical protein